MSQAQTPMMRQYLAIRRELPPKTILLFRLGDFYEMFGEDARVASGILNVALTKRGDNPMCGVPFHSARGYIEKLVAAGYKVAICDQVGEVQSGKLVRRELTEILSAGTLETFGLDDRSPNYLAAVCERNGVIGLAACELSTGELQISQPGNYDAVLDELARLGAKEIIAPAGQQGIFERACNPTWIDDHAFSAEQAEETLREHFGVHSLDGFGCDDLPVGISAAGGLIYYVTVQLRRNASHVRGLKPRRSGEFLLMDASTQAHLELVNSRGGREMSLLGTVDRTVTPMGARTLRDWILRPLRKPEEIVARQEAIARMLEDYGQLAALRDALTPVRDMERCVSRLNGNSGNARDLAALAASLEHLPRLTSVLNAMAGATGFAPAHPLPGLLESLAAQIDPQPELANRLREAVVEEPPATTREGGMIRDGFDEGLDALRSAARDGKKWVADLQEREINRTGIKSLKVRFTSVFGYFIEITKANLASVPDDYIRKQTTVNGERFITPELKEIEGRILGAEERARARETELFYLLRSEVVSHMAAIQKTAAAVGAIDALCGLAETARVLRYKRPEICTESVLEIRQGRHPILDASAIGERFVPNDTSLDAEAKYFAIITGPNMAGKSTYLRQVGLLVVLAQVGSFLPVASARIGVADRIFTRVGAGDDPTKGQSTFMVEMNETASILHNATASSLVLLDEIGRGTSTFDGLSIAWSVAEFLHDQIGCRTLFATHYHEMTDLERSKPGVLNLNVSVREWNDQVIFLRKILPGCADQSYGIQVARLAGLPEPVLARAREILQNLERAELSAEGEAAFAKTRRKKAAARRLADQLDLL